MTTYPTLEDRMAPDAPAPVSIHDFTITVDTRASVGDKLVAHLDRDGQPTLVMECGAPQLLWVIQDPEMFATWYAMASAARPADAAEVATP